MRFQELEFTIAPHVALSLDGPTLSETDTNLASSDEPSFAVSKPYSMSGIRRVWNRTNSETKGAAKAASNNDEAIKRLMNDKTRTCPICGDTFTYVRASKTVCDKKECKNKHQYSKRIADRKDHLVCAETKVVFDRNETGRRRTYKDDATRISHNNRIRLERCAATCAAVMGVLYRAAAKNERKLVGGIITAIEDLLINRKNASETSFNLIGGIIFKAGVDLGGSSINSIILSAITNPRFMFPEREVFISHDGNERKRRAVKIKAENLNKEQFVDADWSKWTMAEFFNRFCASMYGINTYSYLKMLRDGGFIAVRDRNWIDPQNPMENGIDVAMSILAKNGSKTVYAKDKGGKLRQRTDTLRGPGAEFAESQGCKTWLPVTFKSF